MAGRIPKQHVGCICGHQVRGVTNVVEGEEGPVRTSISGLFFGAFHKVEHVSRAKWTIIGSDEWDYPISFSLAKYKTRSIVALSLSLIPSSFLRFTMVKAVVLGAAGQYPDL